MKGTKGGLEGKRSNLNVINSTIMFRDQLFFYPNDPNSKTLKSYLLCSHNFVLISRTPDSDNMYSEGSLVEQGNDGVDPLDTLDNALFNGQNFSRWCQFSTSTKFYSEDDCSEVISPMVLAEAKTVKMNVSDLDSLFADDVDSCDRMYWIVRNCFHLKKMVLHDHSGKFGIQKLFSLWAKPNKLRCQMLDTFEIHFSDYEGQIEDEDYFVSFLVSNIKFLKELTLIGSNFGDQRALEFSEKVFKKEPFGESKFCLVDDKITETGLKEILHSQWIKKCKHITLKIVPTVLKIEALIDFFIDPSKELNVQSFTLSPFSTNQNPYEMDARHHIELSTALYFHPKVTAFKISGFVVTYDKGHDDWICNFSTNKRKRLLFCLNSSN
jgi:hypothetical protein